MKNLSLPNAATLFSLVCGQLALIQLLIDSVEQLPITESILTAIGVGQATNADMLQSLAIKGFKEGNAITDNKPDEYDRALLLAITSDQASAIHGLKSVLESLPVSLDGSTDTRQCLLIQVNQVIARRKELIGDIVVRGDSSDVDVNAVRIAAA